MAPISSTFYVGTKKGVKVASYDPVGYFLRLRTIKFILTYLHIVVIFDLTANLRICDIWDLKILTRN